MSEQTNYEPCLQDVLEFNEQLRLLSEAGIGFDLGQAKSNQSMAQILLDTNYQVALHMGRGKSVSEYLTECDDLPSNYRLGLVTWLQCDRSPEAFGVMNTLATRESQVRSNVETTVVQPWILVGLVYLSFLLAVFYSVPRLESIYTQLGDPPGFSLIVLSYLRATVWYWGIAVPVLWIGALLLWRSCRNRWRFEWMPGNKRVVQRIQNANFAKTLSRLIDRGMSLVDATKWVRSPNASPSTSPSILAWAVSTSPDPKASDALRLASSILVSSTNPTSEKSLFPFPVLLAGLLGGTLVLALGLALYGPAVELLMTLTKK